MGACTNGGRLLHFLKTVPRKGTEEGIRFGGRVRQCRGCPRNCVWRADVLCATGKPGRRTLGTDPQARRPAVERHPSTGRGCLGGADFRGDAV